MTQTIIVYAIGILVAVYVVCRIVRTIRNKGKNIGCSCGCGGCSPEEKSRRQNDGSNCCGNQTR